MTIAHYTRVLESVDEGMDGWVDALRRSGRSPARYSQRKETDRTQMEVHCEDSCW